MTLPSLDCSYNKFLIINLIQNKNFNCFDFHPMEKKIERSIYEINRLEFL